MKLWFFCILVFFMAFLIQSNADCKVDILLLFDSSSSLQGVRPEMVSFVRELSRMFNIGRRNHRVAFLEYTSSTRKGPRKEFGEFKNNREFQKFIDTLPSMIPSVTHTGGAMEIAWEMLEKVRRDATVIVAVITDGKYHDDPPEILEKAVARILAKYGKRERFYLYCIAASQGKMHDKEGMKNITGHIKDSVIHPPDVEGKAMKLLLPVLGESCGRTTVITTTTTTTTTTTEKPPTECEVDLLFLVDFSSSVDEVHRQFIEEAIRLLEGMTVSPYHTRVAMVKYSGKDRHEIVFHFKKHDTFEAVANEMRSAPYTGGTTWTGAGIRLALTEFNETYGARPGLAKKVVVVYTDGYSQEDPAPAAEEMRANDIEMYAVGLSHSEIEPDQQQLQDIAGDENNVFINKNEELAKRLAAYNRNCKG